MDATVKSKTSFFAALLFTAFSASAGDVFPPTPVIGETYEYHKVDNFTGIENQHWTLMFQGMKNGNYVYSGINGTKRYAVYKNKDLNNFYLDKETGSKLEFQVFKWPLTVGDSHSYQSRDGTVKVNVEAIETVETAAGVFDAYRIKLNGMWHDKDYYSGPWYEIYWYAPSVGYFVKIEYSSADQLGRHIQWTKTEIVKHTVPSNQLGTEK